jgi:hypothetical protein
MSATLIQQLHGGSLMNKPMVLVIHGMGTHNPGETKKIIADGLNNAAENFGLSNFDIYDKVEFYQFNYSDFLDKIRLKDAEQASKLIDHINLLKGHGLGERAASELIEFFAGFGEDKMFYTHWMDVLYYGLMFWGEKIRVDLAKKINDLMIEKVRAGRELHIIAHSLGTSVLHDTLSKIFRKDTDLYSEVPQLDTDRFKIDSLWTVANVSRLLNLLNDIEDPNHSIVTSDIGGCTDLLFNMRNEFDPFCWIKTYKRPIARLKGKHIKVDTIRKTNTHDLGEYVEHPDFSARFLTSALKIRISKQTYYKGMAEYKKTCLIENTSEFLAKVKEIKPSGDPKQSISAIKKVIKAAHELNKLIETASE